MGCLTVAARAAGVVFATWAALVAALLLPALLPADWQYYVYSPASVGLWMLSVLVVPVFTCVAARRWIVTGRKDRRAPVGGGGPGRR
ncbi:hypothetical protein ABZ484_16595 [Streptomyces sp. NPDC006393]|uniref:hypothetical protein n=1 Tax=Streptomyces sp. NPDC006393 TaxID=3156763 RepID=UPI0033E2CE48